MSKKHFIALAEYLRKPDCEPFTESQIQHIADFCQSQNPNFKRERWLGFIKRENGPNGGTVRP